MTANGNNKHEKPTPHKPGPKFRYNDPADLQAAVDAYFATCKQGRERTIILKDGTPKTLNMPIPCNVAGLALALGFNSRQSLLNYNGEMLDILTRAKLRIEADNVEKGQSGEYEARTNNLNLASNYGYSQRSSVSIDFDEQLQAIIKALPEKYAIQVQAALVNLAGKKRIEGKG